MRIKRGDESVLELTTRFRGITTGMGARKRSASGSAAVGAAMAHLRYVSRASAATEVAVAGLPPLGDVRDYTGCRVLQKELRVRLQARAQSGGKVGRRIAEKMIISLRQTWGPLERKKAMDRIVQHIAPLGSEAAAIAYFHSDTPGNPHIHILAVDGKESLKSARQRRPDALRVRRRDVIRLGDRGRPKSLRCEIASIMNGVARESGVAGVEWRSFKDRGITRPPKRHIGPERRARMDRVGGQGPSSRSTRRRGRVAQMTANYAIRQAVELGYDLLDVSDEPSQR